MGRGGWPVLARERQLSMFIYGTHHLVLVRAAPQALWQEGLWVGVVCWVKYDQKKKRLSYQLFRSKSCKQGNDSPVLSWGSHSSRELPRHCSEKLSCPVLSPPRHLGFRTESLHPHPGTAFSGCKDNAAQKDDATMDSAGGKNYNQLHTQPSSVVPGGCNQLQMRMLALE